MIPSEITRDHVLRAIEQIGRATVPNNRASRDYDLILEDGRRLPPKYVIAEASLLATGRRLGSDEFGGGDEANGFLTSLGFFVGNKSTEGPGSSSPSAAPSRTNPASGGSRIRVARAILNMGVTPSEFRALAKVVGETPWTAHRKLVTAQFRRDPATYNRRLTGLAHRAAEMGAQYLVLPACTVVHDAGTPAATVEAAFAELPCVATGRLELTATGYREYAEVRAGGAVIDAFNSDSARWMDGGAVDLFAAISSTIWCIGNNGMVRSSSHPPHSSRPALVLDMGHHQYGGRYIRLLDGVARRAAALVGGRRAPVILSYWKYRDTEPVSGWWKPEESWITRTRFHEAWPAGGPTDIIDAIDIELST